MPAKRVPTTEKVHDLLEEAIGSEGVGTAVLPANEASVNVLHGLGRVPFLVVLTPQQNIGVLYTPARANIARSSITRSALIESLAAVGNFWVTDLNDTSFNIHISMPFGFEIKFFWLAKG